MSSGADPYVPRRGDRAYRVRHYDLEIEYRVSSNRLTGRATIVATAVQPLSRISLDLAGLRASKVTVNRRRPARYAQRDEKLHVWPATDLAAGDFTVDVQYAGNPQPVRSAWGDVGWEELTEGALVAGQPSGAPTWFPCNDHPGDKATYRIAISTDSPYHVVANGRLTSRHTRASQTSWVFEQTAPMATYLATVQIGRYTEVKVASSPVTITGAVPAELARVFRSDFGRQQDMMKVFAKLFGPYPFGAYTVVVADDPLEIPLEAQGLSVFGSNHLDGRRGAERLIAHELAHQWFGNSLTPSSWRDIWLNEGFACYAEWLWSENSGGLSAAQQVAQAHAKLAGLPQDLVISDPGPRDMFDDRLYKRGAITLHAIRLRLGDDAFFDLLRSWTKRHRHGSVTTAGFTELASSYADVAPLLATWLDAAKLPALPGSSAGLGKIRRR